MAGQAVVRTLGDAVVNSGAIAILLSSDICEKQQMAQQSQEKAIENMRAQLHPFSVVSKEAEVGHHIASF